MMEIAMVCGRKILHVFSVYMLHNRVGLMRKRGSFPQKDLLMVAGDRTATLDQCVMVLRMCRDVSVLEAETKKGKTCWDYVKSITWENFINSYYQKRQEHLILYKNGGNESQIDFVLCRKYKNWKWRTARWYQERRAWPSTDCCRPR